METTKTIIITGAAGFIGSCMAGFLNQKGYNNLILVDDFTKADKLNNFNNLHCIKKIHRSELENELQIGLYPDLIIHFGARTDTTEMDYEIHKKWNLDYSIMLWNYCTKFQIPFIYASSAATYGDGELGYDDDQSKIPFLHPLNPYGVSKNEFDRYILNKTTTNNIPQESEPAGEFQCPPFWYGLKFFNVYGPNEYHKARMASVIFHAFKQIKEKNKMKLFRSHRADFKDGEQMRDFIYVKDILKVTFWLIEQRPSNGIYNLGSGKATTFLHLAQTVFKAMEVQSEIEFIDTPLDIREKYQYFTEAKMDKLRKAGYHNPFFSIDEGIQDYVQNYLKSGNYYPFKSID